MLVTADRDDRRIDLRVTGPEGMRRSALNIVLDDLEVVHKLNPESSPKALVPLPDSPEDAVSYTHLRTLEDRKGLDYSFLPEGAEHEYTVRELLEGVRREPQHLSSVDMYGLREALRSRIPHSRIADVPPVKEHATPTVEAPGRSVSGPAKDIVVILLGLAMLSVPFVILGCVTSSFWLTVGLGSVLGLALAFAVIFVLVVTGPLNGTQAERLLSKAIDRLPKMPGKDEQK